MESFELIDNFFQIVVLICAAAAAGIFALRRRSRDLLILSLAYDNKLFNRVEKALLNETPYKIQTSETTIASIRSKISCISLPSRHRRKIRFILALTIRFG